MNEAANTFRRLNDEPLLIKSIWCRLNIHNWTQWGQPYNTSAISKNIQTRHCANCNKFEAIQIKIKQK